MRAAAQGLQDETLRVADRVVIDLRVGVDAGIGRTEVQNIELRFRKS